MFVRSSPMTTTSGRYKEVRSFLSDLLASRSVILPLPQDICNIAFRLVRENQSIVIFGSGNSCGDHEAAVPAGPCITLRHPTENEAEAMTLLGWPPTLANNL